MQKRILLPIIVVGFAIGLLGQKMWQQKPTRVDRIYSLFAEVCLPQHRGAQLPALDALGLVSYDPKDGNLLWIDPLSGTFLKFDDRSCSIQFHDRETGLTRDQGNALADMIAGLVETEFPSLRLDPEVKLQETAMTKAWMAGEFAKPDRWGIGLFIYFYTEDQPAGDGSLWIAKPRSQT